MKKTKSKFQNRILYSAWFVFIALVILIALFVFFSLSRSHNLMSDFMYDMILVVVIIILFTLFLVYKKYVLKPINNLEEALKLLEEVNDGENLKLNVNANSLSDTLTRVLNKLKESLAREHSEILLRQESEYAELQSQINPHFLYNTLESIRGQALIDDNYKIADMTEALGKYFRYNIGKDNDQVTLSEEIESIYNYIRIQQYRFEDKFQFHIYPYDDSDEYLDCMIPKMTLQPIVENAIFHGVESKVEKGHISIHIEMTEERLNITVADDGVGMDEDTLNEMNEKLNKSEGVVSYNKKVAHNGIAMENVNNRLKLLFGVSYGISVSSTLLVGTEVEIRLPRVLSKDL